MLVGNGQADNLDILDRPTRSFLRGGNDKIAYAKALAAPIVVTPQRTADEVLALAYVDCGPRLITLETYERKARSRRAKALRALWE